MTTTYPLTSHVLPVGITREPSNVYAVRTPEHLATVLSIAARANFDFASANPFSGETADHFAARGQNHTDPIWFLWHDTSGELHATRIGKSGILREITGSQATAAN